MEDFASIKPSSSVVKLASCLEKIYTKIVESRDKQVPEHQIKEIEFLKSQCKHEHMQLSLMSCQTLVRLVDEVPWRPTEYRTACSPCWPVRGEDKYLHVYI